MENLKELLAEELKDLYSAEKQIVKALPKIIRGAASDELKAAIQTHLASISTLNNSVNTIRWFQPMRP
jgi:ferritin-like metal-binding protein YciE